MIPVRPVSTALAAALQRRLEAAFPRGIARSAALAALVLWFSFLALSEALKHGEHQRCLHYSVPGMALLTGVDAPPEGVSARMPLASVGAALMFGRPGPGWRRFWHALPAVLVPLLLLALGVLAASPGCALAAFVLFHLLALGGGRGFLWTYPQSYYSALVLTAAALMVWRAGEPGRLKDVLFAAAVGVTLIFRSPLVFFPPLLAAVEVASGRTPLRERWKPLLILTCLPPLFIVPTLHMNWVVHGRWIPFESGPVMSNIVTGATGMVSTVAGDWRTFIDGVPDLAHGGAMRWAFGEILAHPLRYAASCLERAAYAFMLHPWLFALAGVSTWLERRRPEIRALALLTAYFVGIHCLMSVRSEYFVPLWPLLTVLAASGLLRVERLRSAWKTEGVRRAAIALACGVLALAAAPSALALYATRSYAALARLIPPGSDDALERAVAASPDDAWLRLRRARRLLGRNRPSEAVEEYARALELDPGDPGWRLESAWAHMRDGRPALIERYRVAGEFSDFGSDRFHYLRILAWIGRFFAGRRAGSGEDQALIELAFRTWSRECIDVPRVGSEREREASAALRSRGSAAFLMDLIGTYGWLLSPSQRLALAERLPPFHPDDHHVLVEEARRARSAGDQSSALGFLALVDASSLPVGEARKAARLYGEMGQRKRAEPIWRVLLDRGNDRADIWIDRAHAAGRGKAKSAAPALERALSLDPSPEQKRRIALLYQGMGEYARAIELLEPLTRDPGIGSEALRDKGICEHLAGSSEKAIEDLEAAVRREPGLISAYVSLGAVYTAAGSPGKARKTYERGLEATPLRGEREARGLLLDELKGQGPRPSPARP